MECSGARRGPSRQLGGRRVPEVGESAVAACPVEEDAVRLPGCRGADAGVAAGPLPWAGRGGLHPQGAVAEGGDVGKGIPSEHLAASAGSLGSFGLLLALR